MIKTNIFTKSQTWKFHQALPTPGPKRPAHTTAHQPAKFAWPSNGGYFWKKKHPWFDYQRVAIGLLIDLVGGFNPSEEYESQWEGLSHILWNCLKPPIGDLFQLEHIVINVIHVKVGYPPVNEQFANQKP